MEEPKKIKHIVYPVKDKASFNTVELSELVDWAKNENIEFSNVVIYADAYSEDEPFLNVYGIVEEDPKIYAEQIKEYRKYCKDKLKKEKDKKKKIDSAFKSFDEISKAKAEETRQKLLNFKLED